MEILGLSPSQSQTGSFALVLGEEMGNRRLPIIIGVFEAQAIAVQIESIIPNRPMTHDLFKSFAEQLNFTVKEVYISDLREGIFYAKLICGDDLTQVEIDSRPSDAIAIGLRFDAPIYTTESILSEAGIVSGTISEDSEEAIEEQIRESIKPKRSLSDDLKEMGNEELNKLLDEALANEEYERAAIIRDELGRRN